MAVAWGVTALGASTARGALVAPGAFGDVAWAQG